MGEFTFKSSVLASPLFTEDVSHFFILRRLGDHWWLSSSPESLSPFVPHAVTRGTFPERVHPLCYTLSVLLRTRWRDLNLLLILQSGVRALKDSCSQLCRAKWDTYSLRCRWRSWGVLTSTRGPKAAAPQGPLTSPVHQLSVFAPQTKWSRKPRAAPCSQTTSPQSQQDWRELHPNLLLRLH